MNINFKKTLLASTAILAAASFTPAAAQAADLTLASSSTWALDNAVAGANAGDNVNIVTFDLTVANAGVADDGGGVNLFTLGAVTGTTGDVLVTTNGVDADLAMTADSVLLTGAGSNFTVRNLNADNSTVTAGIDGNFSIGGNLIVLNQENSTADTVSMTVGGTTTVTGTTAVTAGAGAFANSASLTSTGNATFTGAVTVTGGVNAASLGTLTLNGATNAFNGGLTLTDGAGGDARLIMNGLTVAQTVAGTIAGNGTVIVQNAAGATFSGAVTAGAITIENGGAALNSAATFKAAVAAPITLGGAGTGTNTVTFDATTASFAVTGAIAGGAAGETNNIVVSNTSGAARTVTLNTASVTNLDNLSVSGTGTTLTTGQNLTLTGTATVGSGAALTTTGNTIAANISNSGTVNMNGGAITGNITGTGILDVNNSGLVTGSITQSSITVAESADLGVTAAAGARTVTANIVLEDATADGTDATLALTPGANGIDVTGNITTQIDGEGEITIADGTGAVDFVGDIGTSALKIGALTVAGTSNNIITTTGNLYVNVVTLDDVDNLRFIGTGSQTLSGVVRAVTANDGLITVGDGATATPTVTFAGLLGGGGNDPGALTVNTGATAIFAAGGVHEIDGNVTNTGTIQINRGDTLSTVGDVVDASISTFNIGVGQTAGTQTSGILIEGDDVDLSNDTVHFVVNSLQPLDTGASVLGDVFQGDAANTIAGATVTDNSYLYSFALVSDTNNVDVTVTQENTIASAASASAYENVGNVLMTDLAASTDADINAAQGALVSAGTAEEVNEVLESVAPTIDGGAVVAGFDASVQSVDITSTRLASLRSGSETGMVAGEMGKGVSAWAQVFGQTANQDRRSGVDGYDADTVGVAVGVDSENVNDGSVVGVSVSYANTDVESKNANSTDTDVNSYQVSLYGDHDLGDRAHVEGLLAYAHNNIDQTRHDVGFAGNTADADFDSNQYIAYAEAGRDYTVADKTTFTPSILGQYQHITVDDYTETGAGGLNLDVDNDNLDILQLGFGAELSWDLEGANGSTVRPALNAGYRYDLIGDEVQSTSTFTSGGPSFDTDGLEPSRSTFNIGASIGWAQTNNWEFTADYDFEYKADYDAHSGYVRAGYKF